MSDAQVLPFQAGSRSELLSARNIFSIAIVSLSPSSWNRDPDTGLEMRVLHVEARLLAVYKGPTQTAGAIRADLLQRRENALTVSDYHGFWSHQEIETGKQYVLFSNGTSNDPATLMADSDMVEIRLASPALGIEIALAVDVERRLVPVDSKEKIVEIIKTLFNNRERVTGVLGRYAAARLASHYAAFEDAMQAGIMRVVTAEGTTDDLRLALVEFLYDESAEQDLSEQQAIKLLRRLLSWAGQPEAAPMLDRMLQVHLYNLIFRVDHPPLARDKVAPDAAERSSLAKIFAAHPSQRSTEIIAWLNGTH